MKISIFHNIMWSRYKGAVFSAIYEAVQGTDTSVEFTQIAETESDRVALGGIDPTFHNYPHELIFEGNYYDTTFARRARELLLRAWRSNADVVVLPGYERPEYWAMLLALIVRRKKRAVFCDSTAYDRPYSFIRASAKRFFFSQCHGFFCYGIRSRDYLLMHGANTARIFHRCQAAALPATYNPRTALEQRFVNANSSGERPRVLYVGRISEEKGLDTLLLAFRQLRTSFSSAELFLIGSGPMVGQLKLNAEKVKIGQAVHFLGSMGIQELANEYSRASFLVLPSTSEPWGLVVNEALSFGCPVVVSDVCGCVPELVIEGKSGYTFETNKVAELTKTMVKAIENLADANVTSRFCIELIQGYSPQTAARQILDGCKEILLTE